MVQFICISFTLTNANANIAAKRLYKSTGGVCAEMDSCEFIYDLGSVDIC